MEGNIGQSSSNQGNKDKARVIKITEKIPLF